MSPLVRFSTVALVLALALGGASLSGQGVRLVTLRIDLASGAHPALTLSDGGMATITLKDGGTFGFRTHIRDAGAGLVSVTIVDGGEPDSPTLAELDLTVGATAVPSGTSPSFGVAVERIVQR
jgi:hypothetical protein